MSAGKVSDGNVSAGKVSAGKVSAGMVSAGNVSAIVSTILAAFSPVVLRFYRGLKWKLWCSCGRIGTDNVEFDRLDHLHIHLRAWF